MTATTSPTAESERITEIRADAPILTRRTLIDLWDVREVLVAFVVRQVRVRYKQAVVGVGWAIFQPVFTTVIFAVALGRLAHLSSEHVPYFVFALCGMVIWSFFSSAVSAAAESLIAEQSILRKVYFPREVLPLSALGSSLVDLVPSLLILLLAVILAGFPPSIHWLALVFPLAVAIVAAAAFGFLLSATNAFYRDVRYLLPFFIQVGLFASPVVYSLGLVPAQWRSFYAVVNPLAAAVDGVRRVLLHGAWPDPGITAGALAWSLFLLALAYALFKRLDGSIADRL